MKLVSLQIGKPKQIASTSSSEWWDKDWETGFYKKPLNDEVWLGYEGLKGDGQSDLKNHGGVDKAVCVYPVEHYSHWRDQFNEINISEGAFGENFSTSGLLESDVCIGDIYSIGAAIVQVSQPRQPCYKLARRWKIKELANLVQTSGKTGFYFRVIQHGMVQAQQEFKLLERRYESFTISYCNEIMHKDKNNIEAATGFASVLKKLANILGLLEDDPEAYLQGSAGEGIDAEQIETLIQQRLDARTNKDWTEADRIRDELKQAGVELEDKDGTTIWRRS